MSKAEQMGIWQERAVAWRNAALRNCKQYASVPQLILVVSATESTHPAAVNWQDAFDLLIEAIQIELFMRSEVTRPALEETPSDE